MDDGYALQWLEYMQRKASGVSKTSERVIPTWDICPVCFTIATRDRPAGHPCAECGNTVIDVVPAIELEKARAEIQRLKNPERGTS